MTSHLSRAAGAAGAAMLAAGALLGGASAAQAAAAPQIYYSTDNSGTSAIGVAAPNGAVENPALVSGINGDVTNIAVTPAFIFWISPSGVGRANLDGTGVIQNLPVAGFPPAQGVAALAEGIAAYGSHIYYSEAGVIYRANLDGSQAVALIPNVPADITGLSVNGRRILWSANGESTIGTANLTGTQVNQHFIGTGPYPEGVAQDSNNIYWTNGGIGTIGRAATSGASPNNTLINLGSGTIPYQIADDGAHLLWANSDAYGPLSIGTANLDGTGVNNSLIPATTGQPYGVADLTAPSTPTESAYTMTVGTSGSDVISTTGAPVPALGAQTALPAGLSFVDNGDGSGTISGTPTAGAAGDHELTFSAINGVGSVATATLKLTIYQFPVVTTSALPVLQVGTRETASVATTAYPAATLRVIGRLPVGVTFSPSSNGTGTFSGTPAAGAAGSYPVTLTATNLTGRAVKTFTLVVRGQSASATLRGRHHRKHSHKHSHKHTTRKHKR